MSHDASLEPVLRAVEPAARLVPERHLRQVLNFLSDRGRALPSNPDLPYWFSRTDLAAADVLAPEVMAGAEPRLLLLTDPNDRMIEHRPRGEQLRVYWRVLFRAAVLAALDAQLATKKLTPDECARRLSAFGPSAAREIRYVLETEHWADPEASDADRYRVFAAVYLELAHFAGHGAAEFFPALPDHGAVAAVLGEGLDLPALARATKPAGAVEPEPEPPPDQKWTAAPPPAPAADEARVADPQGRLRRADEAERAGNVVRAAVLRAQAARGLTGAERDRALGGADAALGTLVGRLAAVLDWDPDTAREWHQALGPLLPLAAAGIWPRAARCLYELQRIPADLSREVFAVDLPEAIRTLGRRPVRRPLPRARQVMLLMALNKAHKQLLSAGLGEPEQLRLDRLVHHERHRREHLVRAELAPVATAALTAAGLVPASRVEEVARDKIVAELLDRVCDRGFLRLGNLRDAVARNQMKMGDLGGPGELLGGDQLLRADANLAEGLDGVYRRGEFYLRLIQRGSSVFFGTRSGRALTLYALLPFMLAFMVVMSVVEVAHIGEKVAKLVRKEGAKPKATAPPVAPAPTPGAAPAPEPGLVWEFDDDEFAFYQKEPPARVELDDSGEGFLFIDQDRVSLVREVVTSSASEGAVKRAKEGGGNPLDDARKWAAATGPYLLGLTAFFLLVMHSPPFRRAVFAGLKRLWWAVRGAFYDLPAAVWRSPSMRAVRLSPAARFVRRHFVSPLLVAVLAVGVLFLFGVGRGFLAWWGVALFAALTAFYNTPIGWLMQDRFAEALSNWWRMVRVNLIPGLVALFIDWFRQLGNWVERKLYAVDEWMRFRGGDSQGSLALKAVLGLVWFPVAYVTRFGFYLLFEPQVNPVKHFPVVTVSHKVIAPLLLAMVPALAEVVAKVQGLDLQVDEQSKQAFQVAGTIYFFTQLLLPGVFGFLAWELMENWRLYRANRSAELRPKTIGSHGETMRGLLRPGFHSGTVPKLHRKARHALEAGDAAQVAVLHHELEHTAEGVHRFVARELLPLLARAPGWGGAAVEVGGVKFACQRADVELLAPALGPDPLVLYFENVGGVVEGGFARRGWADRLTGEQASVLAFALRGLFDMAAVERYEGRERALGPPPGEGFAALGARMTRDEWAARW